MKEFATSDIDRAGQFPCIYLPAYYSCLVLDPLPWQRAGLQQTASGCGAKLASSYKICFEGKLCRIYHSYDGNAGTAWFTYKGERIFVS